MSQQKKLLEGIFEDTTEQEAIQNLEMRSNHAINSVIHILEDIDSQFSTEDAEDLTRRLLYSIKVRDYSRFERSLNNILKRNDMI